ncbi:Piso0_005859 [Millerozyma farinosa CBS 7064]|uniref:Piso0_005859 protein n=1 Tax=Pichia sorbitophila (strain ATCC MYA-4447 / BCRC 22081 / CBS 7064 / NBRC 10061 / NRRL Y-12695) TaxID=559304 RepID=G8Y052_PICSO|nr:Piso0_005859 [Millerozyma farinosa CBS 7064]
MSASKQRVPQLRNPTLPAQTTPEQRYWRGYVSPQLVKENHPITHINFNPIEPHDFAVAVSTRIQVFSSKTRQVLKTFSRFKDIVYSGEYRYDGKLLVAADATGLVSIYDSYSPKNLLVSLNPSTYPTHVAKFHSSIGNQLITGSDDRVLRLYDISQTTKGPITEFDETYHGDYIRSASFIPGNPNLVSTGCYDGIVRIFDTRQSGAVAKFNQNGHPVEDVLALSPTCLVSAGGPQVKVWDLSRGSEIRELNNFTKTVTTLHNTGERGLLAGSLDGHVKVFDSLSPNWDVKFGWKFSSGGVLSCATSPAPDNKHFVTGLTSGLLSIRTRKTEAKVKQGVKQSKTNTYNRMMRGAEYKGEEEHRIIHSAAPQGRKLKQFEKHLNAFRWSEALDCAFSTGTPKEHTVTILNELKKRGKVRIALYGRDEISLLPAIQWMTKNLEDSRSTNLICDYLGVILEMYGSLIDKSSVLEEGIKNLTKKVNTEIKKCKEASEIGGMLELLAA